jgi:L-alanine-DL-glutamate epimerase-like enolase superfamily enzyme
MTLIKICLSSGIRMRIEDTAGSEFTRAAVAHLAHSVPPKFLLAAYAFGSEEIYTAEGAPQVKEGRLSVSTRPGLGLTPKFDILKDPIAVYE